MAFKIRNTGAKLGTTVKTKIRSAKVAGMLSMKDNIPQLSLAEIINSENVKANGLAKIVNAMALDALKSNIVTLANEELTTTRKLYLDNVGIEYTELKSGDKFYKGSASKTRVKTAIVFNAKQGDLAYDIEYGRGPYDMRRMFFSNGNFRVSKNGFRYKKISFKWLTSGFSTEQALTRNAGIENIMSANLHDVVNEIIRDSPEGLKSINTRLFNAYGVNTDATTLNSVTGAKHKTALFNGMLIGKKQSGEHSTIRTISEKPAFSEKGVNFHNTWINKGIQAHQFFKRTVESVDLYNKTNGLIKSYISQRSGMEL